MTKRLSMTLSSWTHAQLVNTKPENMSMSEYIETLVTFGFEAKDGLKMIEAKISTPKLKSIEYFSSSFKPILHEMRQEAAA